MGKTSIANTVCYKLRGEGWKTVKVELREQGTYRHFLRTSVQSIIKDGRGLISGEIKTSDNDGNGTISDQILIEEINLKDSLLEFITEKMQRKLILMFDNLDDEIVEDACDKNISEEQSKILSFFECLLRMMSHSQTCKTRLIVTSRSNFLLTANRELRKAMLAIEVNSLDMEEARKLTLKCLKQWFLSDQQINVIVTACCACPLAIRVISDVINDSTHATDVITILQTKRDVILSPSLRINECLRQPFEKLKEQKCTLCQLSLFGTTKFDLNSAAKIVFGKFEPNLNKREVIMKQTELKFTLLLFKTRHLLEIEMGECDCQETSIDHDEISTRQKKIYSVHPLVYKFLKDKANDKDMMSCIQNAKYNYILYFDELVLDIGQEYETNVLVARAKSEKLKTHILTYKKLMEEYESFSYASNQHTFSSSEDARRRSNVVEMICNPEHHLNFLKAMVSKSEDKSFVKLSWEIEYITATVRHHQCCDNIEKKCKQIVKFLYTLKSDKLSEGELLQLHILKGRTLFLQGKLTNDMQFSKNCLYEAKQIFKSKLIYRTPFYKLYLAEIYNEFGCLFCRQKNMIQAIKMHLKAVKVLLQNNIQTDNIIIFYANLGQCHFSLKNFEESLKYYNSSIDNAKFYGMEGSDIYLRKLLNRGNAFLKLRKLDEASKDLKECSDLVKKLYDKPCLTEILIRHAQGCLIRRKIIQRHGIVSDEGKSKDEEDMLEMVREGIQIYEKLKRILSPDLLAGNSDWFPEIQRTHSYFLNQGKAHEDLKTDATQFYSKYHTIESKKDIDFKPPISESKSLRTKKQEKIQLTEGIDISLLKEGDEEKENSPRFESSTSSSSESSGEEEISVPGINHSDKKMSDENAVHSPDSYRLSTTTCNDIAGTSIRGSSTSSGYQSMNASSSNADSVSSLLRTESLPRQCSWSDDDVFTKRQTSFECALERMRDLHCTSTDTSLKSPSSSSSTKLEYKPLHFEVHKGKRQLSEDDDSYSANEDFSNTSKTPEYKCQSTEENLRQNERSTKKYHKGKLDEIVHDLEELIPSVKPRMRTLVRDLDTGEAELVDDKKGRPFLKYKD
ncbi:uncharacterized protein LOC134687420 isoform X2 [Mytilus trossulus]|uniref:uncharacterized protein LOC134687420 isoform X2 n=1 Tax=Mytilus trossulus TaxID=6551 RepID=UPI00300780AE